ncbi:MAG: hypothetical protein ACLR6J_13400 [Parabacteroides merdae]
MPDRDYLRAIMVRQPRLEGAPMPLLEELNTTSEPVGVVTPADRACCEGSIFDSPQIPLYNIGRKTGERVSSGCSPICVREIIPRFEEKERYLHLCGGRYPNASPAL